MKTLICGLTLSLGIFASAVQAERMITVDGTQVPLSELMSTCQELIDDAAAQFACFSDLTRLMDEQVDAPEEVLVPIPDALDALRNVAQYQDDDTGLLIAGTDCRIQITYYNNYYHISRRNISGIDLFSAQFDVAQFRYDQTSAVQGSPAPLSKGVMDDGATAVTHGGVALESAQYNFAPRSPRASLDVYASEVIGQLQPTQGQTFEFVLIHPQRNQASADIWAAFEVLAKSCKA